LTVKVALIAIAKQSDSGFPRKRLRLFQLILTAHGLGGLVNNRCCAVIGTSRANSHAKDECREGHFETSPHEIAPDLDDTGRPSRAVDYARQSLYLANRRSSLKMYKKAWSGEDRRFSVIVPV